MNFPFFRRHHVLTASEIGRRGGIAAAQKQRAPIRERTKQMRAELGLPDDARLGNA